MGLQELGVRNNDFVAVFMTNSPEMVIVIYALTKLGAVPALVNSALRSKLCHLNYYFYSLIFFPIGSNGDSIR